MTKEQATFHRALNRVQAIEADLAAARVKLANAENALSDALGYQVRLRAPQLLRALERVA